MVLNNIVERKKEVLNFLFFILCIVVIFNFIFILNAQKQNISKD